MTWARGAMMVDPHMAGSETLPPQSEPSTEPVFTVGDDRLQLLVDGPARLAALVALIDGAKASLRLLYYIWADDPSGRRVRDALVAAVDRGVSVSVIVDGFGSEGDEAIFTPLRGRGAAICRFLPRFGRRYLLRNHQKLAIADERRAIVGGFNIEDDYFKPDENGWRDLGLLVDGPIGERMARYFDAVQDWVQRKNATIRALRRILNGFSASKGDVRLLLGGPTRRLSRWAQCLREDMRRGTHLDLVAGYFAPNPAMLRGVEHVAKHGEALVMTAAKTDHNAAIAAARHTYTRLLKRGVRIFEYQPRKLHTKLFVIDDVVHIGSANFDMRSLFLNLEIMVRIEDHAFGEHVRAYLAGERADCLEVTEEAHAASAGIITRAKWAAAYFVMAVVDANVTRRLNFGIDGR